MENDASFGYWVRRRRKALDLTQEALAEQVSCSVALIRKIESDLRRPSRQTAELLADVLQIAAKERALFLQVARGERSTDRLVVVSTPHYDPAAQPSAPVTPPPLALPARFPLPTTPLIGREHELAQIDQLLRDPACRVVTIAGPGGMGKTRLALTVATHQTAYYPDGIYFVSLAALSGPDLMLATIAKGLGVTFVGAGDAKAQLLAFLRQKQLLLVLDNLEHLLEGVDLLVDMLATAPHLCLLITSRERLNLQGEWVIDLQGLPVPVQNDENVTTPIAESALATTPAVAMFVEHARRATARFSADGETLAAIARICRLVNGMPLGIELAAAWVHLLSCREIADEIERNFDFLSASRRDLPTRHRSLRAVFDHSWQLISAGEQKVLGRLALFRGGFTREAAHAVAGATLPVLAALVSKSLIHRTEAGRYALHDLLRQYAEERLQADPSVAEQAADIHSRYYAEFVQRHEAQLRGPQQLQAIAELNAEIENIFAGWRWAIRRGNLAAIEPPLKSLWFFFEVHGWYQEAENFFAWAGQTLPPAPTTGDGQQLQMLRGQISSLQGWFRERRAHATRFRHLLQSHLTSLEALGLGNEMVDMLYRTGVLDWMTGYALQTQALAQADLTRYVALGEQWSTIRALNLVGAAMTAQGETLEASQIYQAALALAREHAIVPAALDALLGLALVLRKEGQLAPALTLLTEVAEHPECSLETKERAIETRGLVAQQLPATEQAKLQFRWDSLDAFLNELSSLLAHGA